MTKEELRELKNGIDYSLTRKHGYAHFQYRLVALTDKAKAMTAGEAALVADGMNLCFGGRNFYKQGDTFTGVVHTD